MLNPLDIWNGTKLTRIDFDGGSTLLDSCKSFGR
jgi:hypothetical protein